MKREILEYAVQNQFFRNIVFESDYNKYKKGYIELLELYKSTNVEDITEEDIANKAMIDFILKDKDLTNFILNIFSSYLNINAETKEIKFIKDMPTDLIGLIENKSENINEMPPVEERTKQLTKLTKKQKKLLDLIERYEYNVTKEKLAIELGVTQACIYQRINELEKNGYDIKARMKKATLTGQQKKLLDLIEKYEYNVTKEKLAIELGVTQSCIGKRINVLEKKGYDINAKMKKATLTGHQKKLLDLIEKYEYNVTQRKLAIELGVTPGCIQQKIKTLEKKGYTIRTKVEQARIRSKEAKKVKKIEKVETLAENQKRLLDIYSTNGYEIYQQDIAKIMKIDRIAWISETMYILVNKLCRYKLDVEDLDKIIELIKNKKQLYRIKEIIKNVKNINYENISILIDALLQEEKENYDYEVNFVIEYAQILMDKEIDRIQEPIYQLLIKHKIKLNKSQIKKVEELMDEYEKKIKPQDNIDIQSQLER